MVRVRFAPSPTGYLHQGNVRTALFNFLFARQHGGEFLLRIDDTDPERSRPEYEAQIYEDLAWLGMHPDESPRHGGEVGPYRQSERFSLYQSYLQQLLAAGRVYRCFDSPEAIEEARRAAMAKGKPFVFRGRDRESTPEQGQAKLDQGLVCHYRFAVDSQILRFDDWVYGEKVFDTSSIGDFTVARADGSPVYLFASAVDDALMGITHVIRGEDGMSNTPRQILMQKALGWEPPQFAHLPLILGPDHTLLSKRNGSASIAELKRQGYLSDALLNYLALLGWAAPEGREFLQQEELISLFRLEKVSRSSALFDWHKLKHLNALHLRNLPEIEYLRLAEEFLVDSSFARAKFPAEQWRKTLLALRPNVQTLGELPKCLEFIFGEVVWSGRDSQGLLQVEETQLALRSSLELLAEGCSLAEAEQGALFLEELKKKSKLKGKKLLLPLRLALTGQTEGPELKDLLSVLGTTLVQERLHRALENLQHQEQA